MRITLELGQLLVATVLCKSIGPRERLTSPFSLAKVSKAWLRAGSISYISLFCSQKLGLEQGLSAGVATPC